MLITTICMLIATMFFLWILFERKINRMKKMTEKLPGPKTTPIIGNGLDVGRTPKDHLKCLLRYCSEYGDIYRFWILHNLIIAVSNLEYVRIILSDPELLDKAYFYSYIPFGARGLVLSPAEIWKTHRKIIGPAFHLSFLKTYVDIFNKRLDSLLSDLSENVNAPEFDIYENLKNYTIDNICETTTGITEYTDNIKRSEVWNLLECAQDALMYRVQRPWFDIEALFRLTPMGRSVERGKDKLKILIPEFIRTRKEMRTEDTEHHNVLDTLIEKMEEKIITLEDVGDELVIMFAAGTETVASTMAFMCAILAKHPEVQEKIMEEQKMMFGDSQRSATFNELQSMKYLGMAIKETLRLYPIIPVFGRKLRKDYELGGHILPAGANVMVYLETIYRNPEIFPEPDKFDPNRFLPEVVSERHSFSFLPFGAGSRNCIGYKYGMLQIKAVMSRLLRRYKILPGNKPLETDWKLSLLPSSGVYVRLEDR
ncbi:cytochrome P450 4C1-like isoform X2 [Periplaneta americana]